MTPDRFATGTVPTVRTPFWKYQSHDETPGAYMPEIDPSVLTMSVRLFVALVNWIPTYPPELPLTVMEP